MARMNIESAVAFSVVMLAWALLPGPGLVVVVSRALGSGPRSGLGVIAGLVIADIIFMGIAIIGLSAIAATLGPMFQVVKFVGAAYLIWQGFRVIKGAKEPLTVHAISSGTFLRDIGVGLLVTLGNPKAILFYGSLLPMFLDMTKVGVMDFLVLTAIAATISYLVYGGYMTLATRARRLIVSTKAVTRLRQAAGATLIGAGIVVVSR